MDEQLLGQIERTKVIKMCRVIAVSNQKGGVGKTVSCVNLGIGLAQAGKKVLLIDADPQGSMTISLGYPEPDVFIAKVKYRKLQPPFVGNCRINGWGKCRF